MKIINTNDPAIPSKEITTFIQTALNANQKVLWLVSGGSAIDIAVKAASQITPNPLLSIILIDERYGDKGHNDSNDKQLLEAGFSLPVHSILINATKEETVKAYELYLAEMLALADIKIALVGMGSDGHTAGILPISPTTLALNSCALGYQWTDYYRITATPRIFKYIDKVYLWVQGESKKEALLKLTTIHDPQLQPAQYLKEAKNLVVYTDIKM